jgi:calcium-dependent protein kinase
MRENGAATDEFIPEVLVRMRQFTQMNKLKKEALKVSERGVRKG